MAKALKQKDWFKLKISTGFPLKTKDRFVWIGGYIKTENISSIPFTIYPQNK
jgi:hypothetical protein